MKSHFVRLATCAFIGLCAFGLLTGTAVAQNPAGEFAAFGGVDHADGGVGTGGTFGFHGGWYYRQDILLTGEFDYIRVGGGNAESYDFGGQYLFSLHDPKIKPYARVDFDIAHATGATEPGIGFGFGVRVAGGKNWGVFPEFRLAKAAHPFTFSEIFDGGVYYTFGKR
jgi:hypothetical protein